LDKNLFAPAAALAAAGVLFYNKIL